MTRIEVFDPPLCCPTGVCGPQTDGELARVAADLDWLRRQKIDVRRYNLAHEPTAFVANEEVKRVLEQTNGDGLPVILLDGRVVRHGSYPSRDELACWVDAANRQDELCEADSAAAVGADRSAGSRIYRDGHRPSTEMTDASDCSGSATEADCCSRAANPLVTLDVLKRNDG